MHRTSLLPLLFAIAACGPVVAGDRTDPDAAPATTSPDAASPGTPDAVAATPDAVADAPPAPACTIPDDCASGLCVDGACATQQLVPCADAAPAHASSVIVDVTIDYIDGQGWTAPAACAWACDPGRCKVGDACLTDAPDLTFDPGDTGSIWFGGDDRDLNGDGVVDIRSVGIGESFSIADPIAVTSVGLYFATGFASAATGAPHGATVVAELRDASGAILASATRAVGAGFTGGWVAWNLPVTLPAGTFELTAYVAGVFAGHNYSSGVRTDFTDPLPGGIGYLKELTAPGAMSDWTGWQENPGADHAFAIAAACPL